MEKIKSWLFRRAALAGIRILRILFKGELNSKTPDSYAEFLKYSSAVGSQNFDTFKYTDGWLHAEKLWNLGFYQKSVDIRKDVMNEIYSKQDTNFEGYFPPLLSKDFGVAFGHVGLMAAHMEASKIGIIPKGIRHVPISGDLRSREITKSILNDYRALNTEIGGELFDLPPAWHASERLQLIRTNSGFSDLYEILESLYSTRPVSKLNPILHLDPDYLDQARESIKKKGLPDSGWFTSLHICNAGKPGLRRNQPNESYVKAVQLINSLGGTVIRVGDPSMDPFPETIGVIDLSRDIRDQWLHSYVLSNSLFHIGTTSGPDWVPSLFGVPTLITNATAIGRNTHSLCEKSFFIPKKVVSGNQHWSLRSILNSNEAYAEFQVQESRDGYRLECNTEMEILNATKEMIERLNDDSNTIKNEYSNRIDSIRRESGAIGFGSISSSFIESYKTDYLD